MDTRAPASSDTVNVILQAVKHPRQSGNIRRHPAPTNPSTDRDLRRGGPYPSFSWLIPYCSSFL
jgi:hypothetical protein